jgi:DNA-directed RNA polymerase subunit alpha
MPSFEIECIESREDGPRDLYDKFIIDGLEQGQGITLGNSLRRVLLSDLEGIAISSVRISGVNHEFSTIPGVREDVLEILLNLKEVIFKGKIDEKVIGRIRIQGPAIVTTDDFDLPPEISLIDSKQYIATICSNNILEMEFYIEPGKGYKLMEKNLDIDSSDFLQIDSIFMPVKKVNYVIEDIRYTQNLIKDRLILEVWTNGSITPKEAVSQSSVILTNLFSPLKNIHFKSEDIYEKEDDSKINQILIEDLQLSVRAYNCLKRAQINTIGDLLSFKKISLLNFSKI